MKVLIVDDIQMARFNMKKALEKEGVEVFEAGTGKKAISAFKQEKPNITFLDIELPDMNGISVLKEIKGIDKDAKVIMVTGISNQYNFVESLKQGADNFLVKPIDLDKLVEVVRSSE
jgi:two-component system chemotaxis response regulator CheY